jgi:hypothetical protein
MDEPVGTAPTRRLTKDEYVASLKVAGLEAEQVRRLLPVDELNGLLSTNPFPGNVSGQVSRADLESYVDAAEQVAAQVDMAKYFGCDVAQETCVKDSILRIGKRLLRRSVSADEQAAFLAQWQMRRTTPAEGARLVLQSMLVMPSFLYRPEIGAGTGAVRFLTPYELAARLSFFATGAAPDDRLLASAESGELSTPDGLQNAFKALLKTDAGKKQIRNFYSLWTGVGQLASTEKDLTLFPQFTAPVKARLQEETLDFFEAVHGRSEPFSSLFDSRRAFVSSSTAALYGVVSTSATSEQVELPSNGVRSGFLTLPGLLATTAHSPSYASPIFRGKFVRFNVMCRPVPPPGPDVTIVPPPMQPGMTTRERYDALMVNMQCRGCHLTINPLGYAYLRFNAVGAQIETDAQKPIDDRAEVVASGDDTLDGPFDGPLGLSRKLAQSAVVQTCFASQWLQFALARQIEPSEQCTVEQAGLQLGRGVPLESVIASLVASDAFTKVRVSP